jgi:hypothetical protein
MALNPKYTATLRNALLTAINTDIGANALLRIYDGSQPASADTAVTSQTLLAELTLGATPGVVSSGVWTANSITSDSSANATGTASWFRLVKTGGSTVVMDGTVGTSSSDMIISNTNITAGGSVAVTSWTITAPHA